MSNDDIGDRIKGYEGRETDRRFLPYLPIYARIDGKGFSKFTKGMERPFDIRLTECMWAATKYLVEQTQARIGYTQSDEISLVYLEEKVGSQIMFDGKVQKLTSVLASMATAAFTRAALKVWPDHIEKHPPVFDCRVFQLPTLAEATNAVLWRELDATKNAISMAARTMFSHKELQDKSGNEMQEMMWQKGVNFNDYPAFFKRGQFFQRRKKLVQLEPEVLEKIPLERRPDGPVVRWSVEKIDVPKFSTVINRTDVIFNGADPEVKHETEVVS